MAKQHFIVCMRDENMRLIGPFANVEALCSWAQENGGSLEHDPRWQSIQLDEAGFMRDENDAPANHYMVEVYAPDDGPMPA